MRRSPHLVSAAVTLAVALALALLAPWYALGLGCFACGMALAGTGSWGHLLIGALAGALVWGAGAAFFSLAGGALPARIAALFGLGSPLALGLAVAAVAAVWAGLAQYTGALARECVVGRRTTSPAAGA